MMLPPPPSQTFNVVVPPLAAPRPVEEVPYIPRNERETIAPKRAA
jgi:hypothetical protein